MLRIPLRQLIASHGAGQRLPLRLSSRAIPIRARGDSTLIVRDSRPLILGLRARTLRLLSALLSHCLTPYAIPIRTHGNRPPLVRLARPLYPLHSGPWLPLEMLTSVIPSPSMLFQVLSLVIERVAIDMVDNLSRLHQVIRVIHVPYVMRAPDIRLLIPVDAPLLPQFRTNPDHSPWACGEVDNKLTTLPAWAIRAVAICVELFQVSPLRRRVDAARAGAVTRARAVFDRTRSGNPLTHLATKWCATLDALCGDGWHIMPPFSYSILPFRRLV